jgi:hypothetical protein
MYKKGLFVIPYGSLDTLFSIYSIHDTIDRQALVLGGLDAEEIEAKELGIFNGERSEEFATR